MRSPPSSAEAGTVSDSVLSRRRILCFIAVVLNCLTAGSIFTFPLFAPPLARALSLTGAQTNALASASILGEYASAVGWGTLTDRRGPGAVSLAAALLFGVGYGLLGWRYMVSVEMQMQGQALPEGQWIYLCGYYFLAGCGTAASYFSAIIAATKSTPSRHSGLAIGLPCSIFGLSPLFLSTLAPYFTTTSESARASGVDDELDPGKWLLFLGVFLFLVNVFGSIALKEIPCDDAIFDPDSGMEGSNSSSVGDEEASNERTVLLGSRVGRDEEGTKAHQPFSHLLSTPTFWLFGAVIFLATGPCEMVLASLGGIVESLLGVHTQSSSSKPSRVSPLLLALASSSIPKGVHDPRALALRRLHVQVLSAANTISRLLIGFLSDWLSYAASPLAPSPPDSRPASIASTHSRRTWKRRLQLAFHRPPPRVSRLAFLVLACAVLSIAFFYASYSLTTPTGLWILSLSVGTCYGLIFTLAPAIVRAVYPLSMFGRNWGILSLFSAFGASLFTPLFGVLLDHERERQAIATCVGRDCFARVFALSGVSALAALGITGVLWRGWWRGKV